VSAAVRGETESMRASRFKQFAKRVLVNHHGVVSWLIPDRYFPYRLAGGRIYLNVKESPMMLARAFGMYEVEKMEAVRVLLRPGATFVDVGANKGDFTLLAA
jgi:hypothetical protein